MSSTQRNIEVDAEVWSRLKIEAMKKNRNVRGFAGEILANYINRDLELDKKKSKVVILAAGSGTRLLPLTKDKPKCMLTINGKTILQRQIEIFKRFGIDDIIVVRGYKKNSINYSGVKYYNNPNYQSTNLLYSLFQAEPEMDDEFIVAYGDILFKKDTVEKLLKNNADISLVVDSGWREKYKSRLQHPIEEAEKVVLQDGRVISTGKGINQNKAHGEFIGIAKFSRSGAEILRSNFRIAKRLFEGKPFHEAQEFEKAFLTDMFQELINRGYAINYVDIKGGWVEIDTPEDLEIAKKMFRN